MTALLSLVHTWFDVVPLWIHVCIALAYCYLTSGRG